MLFQEELGHIPATAVVIEIGPHALLQAILKRSLDVKARVPTSSGNHGKPGKSLKKSFMGIPLSTQNIC